MVGTPKTSWPKDNFETVYAHTMGFEGGYANHPADSGGETWKGVARKAWPHWAGWIIVDLLLAPINGGQKWHTVKRNFLKTRAANKVLSENQGLEKLVRIFYRENVWNSNRCDEITTIDPALARKVFDTAVNMGDSGAGQVVQRACTVLGARNLTIDGDIGPQTVKAIRDMVEYWQESAVMDAVCHAQALRYKGIAARNPKNKVFLPGWLRRAQYRG